MTVVSLLSKAPAKLKALANGVRMQGMTVPTSMLKVKRPAKDRLLVIGKTPGHRTARPITEQARKLVTLITIVIGQKTQIRVLTLTEAPMTAVNIPRPVLGITLTPSNARSTRIQERAKPMVRVIGSQTLRIPVLGLTTTAARQPVALGFPVEVILILGIVEMLVVAGLVKTVPALALEIRLPARLMGVIGERKTARALIIQTAHLTQGNAPGMPDLRMTAQPLEIKGPVKVTPENALGARGQVALV